MRKGTLPSSLLPGRATVARAADDSAALAEAEERLAQAYLEIVAGGLAQ